MSSSKVLSGVAQSAHGASVAPAAGLRRIRLWDLPTRITHWSLVVAFSTAFISGQLGGDWMPLHGQAGLAIVGLLVFRVVWGFIGSTYARFGQFVPGPRRVLDYLQGRCQGAGHNPLGAFSVLGLLALLGLQVGTGLFTNDEIAFTGPLAPLVDEALSIRITGFHHQLANWVLGLVIVHVVAIVFYTLVKKDQLVPPMVTGWKHVRSGESAQRGGPLAFVIALAVALLAVYYANGGGLAHSDSPAPAATVPSAPASTPAPAW